jgi:hypothetical protein
MHKLIAGRWYLMFVCENCQTRQVLFPDLSNGTAEIRATYNVDCAKCHQNGAYDTDIIERYQHREEAKAAVA